MFSSKVSAERYLLSEKEQLRRKEALDEKRKRSLLEHEVSSVVERGDAHTCFVAKIRVLIPCPPLHSMLNRSLALFATKSLDPPQNTVENFAIKRPRLC